MSNSNPKPPPRKEYCVHGHKMEGDNVVLAKRGKYLERQCRECNRRRNRESQAKRRSKKNG